MFSHIMIGSNDIAAARKFYDAVLATVGVSEGDFNEETQRIYYRTSDGTLIVTKPMDGNPATIALTEVPSGLHAKLRNRRKPSMTPLSLMAE